jgi:hypothetical protein
MEINFTPKNLQIAQITHAVTPRTKSKTIKAVNSLRTVRVIAQKRK